LKSPHPSSISTTDMDADASHRCFIIWLTRRGTTSDACLSACFMQQWENLVDMMSTIRTMASSHPTLLGVMVSLPLSTEICTLNTETCCWRMTFFLIETDCWELTLLVPLSKNWRSWSLMKWHWVLAWLTMIDSRILWWCGMVHVCCLEIWSTAQKKI
jgi:hypothetical protein